MWGTRTCSQKVAKARDLNCLGVEGHGLCGYFTIEADRALTIILSLPLIFPIAVACISARVITKLHIWQVGNMAVFQSKKFRPSAQANTIASKYRSALAKHPFALFGLPFIATMVAGSFFLTPATAIRYEKHDRRVQRVSKDEELGIGKNARRVDMKEEYYVSFPKDAAERKDRWLEFNIDFFTEIGRERPG